MRQFVIILCEVVAVLLQVTLCSAQSDFWLPTNGPNAPGPDAPLVNRLVTTDDGYLLAATNAGVYKTKVGTNIWTYSSTGLSNPWALDLAIHPNGKIFAVCYVDSEHTGGVYASSNGGDTWSEVPTGMEPWDPRAIAISRTGLMIVSGTNMAYRSTDGGATWKSSSPSTMFYGSTNVVAFDSSGIPHIGSVYGVYRSTDQGENWQELGHLGTFISTLAFSPSNVCFVGSYLHGVWQIDSRGNWTQSGLEGRSALSMVIDKLGHVFIGRGGSGGVLRWQGDTSWVSTGSGLPATYVWSLTTDKEGYLYAGLYEGSVYRSTQVTTSVEPSQSVTPTDFRLKQNYPNPFNPVTTIHYTVGGTRDLGLGTRKTMLVVYDVLGRQVATLVNEVKAPGSYEVRFDGSGLASGVYLYRLSAGDFAETKRMVLVR